MKVVTVTVESEDIEIPVGPAYQADGWIVIRNGDGLHYINESDLTEQQIARLAPTQADSIYFPEVVV